MQYTVTSQDRPQNSPLYAVSTSLDSFIMFNDEALTEQITLPGLMDETEEEEYNAELSRQFTVSKNPSKPNTGLELRIINPLNLNIDSQESNPQPDEKLEESNHTKDMHQTDKTENNPLWTMYFDGSCTRTNAGAGVWITNTDSKHTECISCKLNF